MTAGGTSVLADASPFQEPAGQTANAAIRGAAAAGVKAFPCWPFDPLPPFGFDVVMADPPWPFALRSAKGERKSPRAHYQTMSLEAIRGVAGRRSDRARRRALALVHMAADRAADAAGRALGARGQDRRGLGQAHGQRQDALVLRSVCEPFVIATLKHSGFRGPGEANLIDGLAREHSRKPDAGLRAAGAHPPRPSPRRPVRARVPPGMDRLGTRGGQVRRGDGLIRLLVFWLSGFLAFSA
jgi:hypothetical protein